MAIVENTIHLETDELFYMYVDSTPRTAMIMLELPGMQFVLSFDKDDCDRVQRRLKEVQGKILEMVDDTS